jgi:hypothetical protein
MADSIEQEIRTRLSAFEDDRATVSEFGSSIGPFELRKPLTETDREVAVALNFVLEKLSLRSLETKSIDLLNAKNIITTELGTRGLPVVAPSAYRIE